jgi:hypothetical protein
MEVDTTEAAVSPTVKDTAHLLELKRRIENLSPGDQLRLAAECIDKGEYDIAETLAANIVDELRALRLLRRQP